MIHTVKGFCVVSKAEVDFFSETLMARVNSNILGISALKWTGMGEYNSDDHCIYYCEQESLRRNGVALIVNKRVQNAVLDVISKMTERSP